MIESAKNAADIGWGGGGKGKGGAAERCGLSGVDDERATEMRWDLEELGPGRTRSERLACGTPEEGAIRKSHPGTEQWAESGPAFARVGVQSEEGTTAPRNWQAHAARNIEGKDPGRELWRALPTWSVGEPASLCPCCAAILPGRRSIQRHGPCRRAARQRPGRLPRSAI